MEDIHLLLPTPTQDIVMIIVITIDFLEVACRPIWIITETCAIENVIAKEIVIEWV
jgi:hypothetical protein